MLLKFTIELYILVFILFLAGKDASSYRMKDKNSSDPLMTKRITRWHRDGVILHILFILPFCTESWKYGLYSLLLRLSFYDFAFNEWAGLDRTYLGGTAGTDIFFKNIFGEHGAVKKSVLFLVILIILNFIL